MKKKLLLYILIILFIFCGIFLFEGNRKEDDENTVVFWTLQLGVFDKYINNIISEFEKENPSIKIKWIDIPYSEGEKRTLAAILTDNPPDLINLTTDFAMLLAEKGALLSIDKSKLEQFLPALAETLKYKNEYYGIPFYVTSAVTLKNKDAVEKSENPITYDELFKIIPKKGKYITMLHFTENDTLLKLLNKYNVNSPQTINTPKSVEIYSEFKRLYDNNLIPKESITQSHRDALEKYMSGQLAYLVAGANFLNMVKENAPSVYNSTEILHQLTGDTGLYDYSLMNLVIPVKSKKQESALKFALYFTEKQNQVDFAKLTTILPVNKYSLQDEYFVVKKDSSLETEARITSAKQLNYLQPPLLNIKNKKSLNTLSSNYIQDILINNRNIKDSLDNFSRDWEKL